MMRLCRYLQLRTTCSPLRAHRPLASQTAVRLGRSLNRHAHQHCFSTISPTASVPQQDAPQLIAEPSAIERLPYYSQLPLDRKAEWRQDNDRLSDLLASAETYLLPVTRDKCLLQKHSQNGAPQLVLLQPASEALPKLVPNTTFVFLGVHPESGAAYFAAEVSDPDALAQQHNAEWRSARLAGPDLPLGDASLAAVATGLLQWHRANQYHGMTGSPTVPANGGYSRKCSKSGQSTYPRIDPAVIMLVTAGDWCLLGRKPDWPTGRYSTLAGFLEVGEPLEMAVAREVLEESSVPVELSSVRYHSSQPWPFPRSLMIGFYAQARLQPQNLQGLELLGSQGCRAALQVGLRPEEVTQALLPALPEPVPEAEEMADVRWFHRETLVHAITGGHAPGMKGFVIPGPYSLAYRLITGWINGSGLGSSSNSSSSSSSSSSTHSTFCGAATATVAAHPPAPGANGSQAAAGGWPGSWAGDSIEQVSLDSGVFKYVLMRVSEPEGTGTGRSKLLVWGHCDAAYHMYIYQAAKAKAAKLGLEVEPLGGGRIEHYPEQQVVNIYGYSVAFGAAPHEVSAALVRKWYPFYGADSVIVSYEGY